MKTSQTTSLKFLCVSGCRPQVQQAQHGTKTTITVRAEREEILYKYEDILCWQMLRRPCKIFH